MGESGEQAGQFASGTEAMRRVEAIDMELEMFERMKNMPPEHKATITEYGHEYIAGIEAERLAIIRQYRN